MDMMEQRRKDIVNFINERGDVTFAQLAENFSDVSQMTLRTDLKALDSEKKIVRIHGGAKSVEVVLGADDYLGRRVICNVEEKDYIARKALSLIKPNTAVYLDSGSTAAALARMWPDQSNFIFTGSMTCVMELSKLLHPTLFILGGELNKFSMSTCGVKAIEAVKSVSFDLAILGVGGYYEGSGFSCGVLMESYLKQAVLRQSTKKVILMDSSKTNKRSTFHICGLKEANVVISDKNISEDFRNQCETAGVDLVC